MNNIKDKIDNSPEGYVTKECYDAVLERANKLDDICRSLRQENHVLRGMMVKVVDAICAFNEVIQKANEQGIGLAVLRTTMKGSDKDD